MPTAALGSQPFNQKPKENQALIPLIAADNRLLVRAAEFL
ncbi:hypothetical protein CARN8_7100005 [mine drainage metagenome]|uniref:Uncharacterized protein n=1 Tax=mine drainage metagenome TaxID=410659 RepID=A0A3P3ZS78_9ZZZZ